MGTTSADRALLALRILLRSSHLAGPDDLPALATAAGQALGAVSATIHLADYDQVMLVPLVAPGRVVEDPVPIEGTLAGRAYVDLRQQLSIAGDRPTLWTPILDGTERLGVLRLEFPVGNHLGDPLPGECQDVASLLAELVITRSLYGDSVERARRRKGMSLSAELLWRLLPPLTFVAPRVAIAGVVAPAEEIAGDSFDYAMNGGTVHVALLDAMGHGMEATLLSAVAVGAMRNARRSGAGLTATVGSMEAEIAAQFGGDKFVTGIVGELDVTSGWWRWITCGHPPAMLLRGGQVVKTLDSVICAPVGLGLLPEHPPVGEERLQPGDRLVLYTDGVIEARDATGEFFGTERLIEFVTRQDAAGRPVAETLRRLNHSILAHQDGVLQDDATTVIVEWLTEQSELVEP